MSLDFIIAPADLDPSDIVGLCEHEPRENWTRVTGVVVGTVAATGEPAAVDWVALCDDCYRGSSVESLRLTVGRRVNLSGSRGRA